MKKTPAKHLPQRLSPGYEEPIEGWETIAQMLRLTLFATMRPRKEPFEAGVVHVAVKGQPKRKVIFAFPSIIKAWCIRKTAHGEHI